MTTTTSSTRNVRCIVSNQFSLTAYTQHSTQPSFATCAVEKGVEVIDDLYGEALEIKDAGNTWLTYGPPMQLARVRYLYRAPSNQLPLEIHPHLRILFHL